MTLVLFSAPDHAWQDYREVLPRALEEAGVDARIIRDAELDDPDAVDFIVYAPSSELQDFSPFSNLKAVLNLWAGVEDIVGNETLRVPLARMVDYGLEEGMVEWCVAHVLRHHLDLDRDICRADADWSPHVPPLARDRRVAVLGLGELGGAVAKALAALNFRVLGWSRRQKSMEGVDCLAGDDGLREALSAAGIVVLLLPLTEDTENLLNAERLSWMAPGAVIVNPGRGPLIDDAALLHALENGRLSHATLDVFREEPLPRDHPFWSHPRVTVTPHIASATRPESAARVIAENVRRGLAGEPFLHLVDRGAGY